MAMDAGEIETLIKEAMPDAEVIIEDLRGDGDHYAASVVSSAFRGKSRFSSIRWCIRHSKGAWAPSCTPCRCKPACRRRRSATVHSKNAPLLHASHCFLVHIGPIRLTHSNGSVH